jgi:phage terminase small subunit
MPALQNPRHERFALAIVAGLAGKTRIERAQSTAYLQAYPSCSNGNSAEAAASRLLRRVKPILDRVKELQAQAARKLEETPQKIATELNEILAEARADRAHGAAVSAALGKAKVLGLYSDKAEMTTKVDWNTAQSMQDIGRKLLQSIGFSEPDDVSVQAAIKATDRFIAELEAIRDQAQGTISAA